MVLMNLFSLQNQVLNLIEPNSSSIEESLIEDSSSSFSSISSSNVFPFTSALAEVLNNGEIIKLNENINNYTNISTINNTSLPALELVLGTFTYLLIIGITILGPLKKVQNYFIVSLAASDMLVALVVMPLHVVKFLADGHWLLGVTICQLFTTADILLCTSSILNLCAIAIDRYRAIHDPIGYAQKRSLKLVGGTIVLVWVLSAVISVPPLIGWNDWTSQTLLDHCELTSEKAFVVFSACGSFFLPLAVMVIVYVKIFLNARQRIRKNRGRSALFKMAEEAGHRSQKAPVAAASVIALASATGAQIFRKSKKRKENIKERISSSLRGTSSATNSSGGGHDGNKRGSTNETNIEEIIGNGGGIDALLAQNNATNNLIKNGGSFFPLPSTLEKRYSLSINLPLPINNIVTATSLDGIKTSGDLLKENNQKEPLIVENGGGNLLTESKATDTVELKTHLKEREKISVAKEKRAAKTIAVIIFVFTFCWLPFFCAYVIMPFCSGCYIHPKVHQAFVWLGYINSSLNPFLYGILNLEFRRAFRKILCPKRVQNAQRRRMSAPLLESKRRKSQIATQKEK
uniref:G_PROTEIN_RECEP_F1_2 domain-containing protein n=1 Tax=Meloidogyne hapla TaxID=6305 RepID=A0A1I8BWZ1_MELHA